MIISHSRKFVFVKTIKVGGTSLEIALSKYCGAGDIIGPIEPEDEVHRRQYAGLGAQNHLRTARAFGMGATLRSILGRSRPIRFDEHMPAWRVRSEIGAERWAGYFTFTIVRNPFDRCVSRFFHVGRYKAFKLWDPANFDQFLRYRADLINENWTLYTERDEPIVDFCVRYEHLETDLAEVSRRIGLGTNLYEDMKGIRTKTGNRPAHTHYSAIIEPRHRELISGLCAAELRLFGYGFDDRAGRGPDAMAAGAPT